MMKERLLSAGVMTCALAVVLLAKYFFNCAFDIFWLFITLACTFEMSKTLNKAKKPCYEYWLLAFPVVYAGIVLMGGLLGWNFGQTMLIELGVIVLAVLLMLLLPFVFDKNKEKTKSEILNKCLMTAYVMVFPVLLMSSMYWLNHLASFNIVQSSSAPDNTLLGFFAIALVLFTSIATDTMAMFGGKIFKGKKLCPTVSFHKTISGFVTGLVFACVASVLVFCCFDGIEAMNTFFEAKNIAWWNFLILGLACGLATTAGDLLASYTKRRCFVKDYGNTFPGHGGFMDRFNGVAVNSFVCLLFFLIA